MSVERLIDLSQWIEAYQLPRFIGSKGYHINLIERNYKVLLNLLDNLLLMLTGSQRAVELAIIDVELHALDILTMSSEQCFLIPKDRIGYMIGRNGQKINAMKKDSGASILIENESNKPFTEVTITGEFSSLLAAVGMIKDRVDTFGHDFSFYNRVDKNEFSETWDEVIYED